MNTVEGFETPGQIIGRLANEVRERETRKSRPVTWTDRLNVPFLLRALAIAGGLVCAGQVILWSTMGAWPFYDTACFWAAGLHLRDGAAVYGALDPNFPFRYAPPLAVLMVPLSYLPLEVVAAGLFGLQLLALRYVCGSWRNAGLAAWLPFVPRELVTGNIDLLMAAAILAGIRGSGVWPALFSLAKFSPAVVLGNRRQWAIFGLTVLGLCALTLPVLHLWPEWVKALGQPPNDIWVPLVVRVPIGVGLLLYRRPWSVAAAAGLLTPAFYFHSAVLLLPAVRVWWDSRQMPTREEAVARVLAGIEVEDARARRPAAEP